MMTRALALATAVVALLAALPGAALAEPPCRTQWKMVGSDRFSGADALIRSQGVTTDGAGWFFSWQLGLERTTDAFLPMALGTIPPQLAVNPSGDPTGENRFGDNHIGDIDYYDGKIYAPVEDNNQDLGVTVLNNPEYQAPHIAVYDAQTLTYTGTNYPLDVGIHEAGVPWVAVDAPHQTVYTAEWDMHHDRLNVFDLQMHFKRFIPLHATPDLGPNFHLSRIQGAKVQGDTMYATRDDAAKSVFAIDLRTGEVSKLFSLNPTVSAELEGLAIRPMPDGSLLHLLIVESNDLPNDATEIHVSFDHFAPGCA